MKESKLSYLTVTGKITRKMAAIFKWKGIFKTTLSIHNSTFVLSNLIQNFQAIVKGPLKGYGRNRKIQRHTYTQTKCRTCKSKQRYNIVRSTKCSQGYCYSIVVCNLVLVGYSVYSLFCGPGFTEKKYKTIGLHWIRS